MILQCYFSLLLRCEGARNDEGERGAGGPKILWRPWKWQQLQEFRVSGSLAAFRTSGCTALFSFMPPVFRSGCVNVSSSSSSSLAEIAGPGLFLLPQHFFGVLVFYSGTRSPQFFTTTGHVTMEDSKILHASAPPQTTSPRHSLESGNISYVVGKEVVEECIPVDCSRLSPQSHPLPASSIAAEQHVSEASRQRHEDGGVEVVDGATAAGADVEGTPGACKDEVAETVALNGPYTLLHSKCGAGGESAANSSAQSRRGNCETLDSKETKDELKQRIEPGNSQTTDSLVNGKLQGSNSVTDGPDRIQKQPPGDELTSTAGSILMGVLAKLTSLDPSEVFKDPVDDSFAPNYSKVIKTPMCFSMMQEKIGLQQYHSWSLFVEDFERICYNAMKYNQKRSRIWNAASTLLRQGKKVMEPYIEHGDSLLGTEDVEEGAPKNAVPDAAKDAAQGIVENVVQDAPENVVEDVAKNVVVDAAKNDVQVLATGTAGELGEDESAASRQGGVLEREFVSKPNSEKAEVKVVTMPISELKLKDSLGVEKGNPPPGIDASKETIKEIVTVASAVRDSLVRPDHDISHDDECTVAAGVSTQMRVNHVNEDVKVEILESTGSEDVRPDSRDEATECSSSFGYTHSKVDSDPEVDGFQQNAEVESELRDGNGALSSACAEDDELAGGNERGKKALNADWKKYRRGIEWRCRWLEVRLDELRARAQKYDRLLEERKAKKSWLADVQPGEESSARSAQMVDSPQKGRILRRLRRKDVENTVDLDVYMARHPLFSRYDKKKKGEMEDMYMEPKSDIIQHVQNPQNLVEPERRVPEESDTEEQLVLGRSSVGGQDSMEQILWKVEALQARVEKAKSQLSKGAPTKSIIQPLTILKPPSNLSRLSVQAPPRMLATGTVPRPPGTKGRPPSGQSPGLSGTPTANGAPQRQGSASLRRKSSDYDINNMVMPVSVGAKYVEHIKHADIWTPHWRYTDTDNAEAMDQSMGGSSSDEDTDDEQFETRHLEMEANERKQRYMLPPKRSPDGDPVVSGKGRSKSGMGKGAGKMAGRGSVPTKVVTAPGIESADSNSSPAFAGSIPKGKRRKRLFNATDFTTNHALRLAAYLAEPSSSLQSPEAAEESIHIEDVTEMRTSGETTTGLILPDQEKLHVQALPTSEQADLKRKRSAASGLQVLANP